MLLTDLVTLELVRFGVRTVRRGISRVARFAFRLALLAFVVFLALWVVHQWPDLLPSLRKWAISAVQPVVRPDGKADR